MPPSKHAVLGPSSSARWLACPGSVELSKGIIEAPSPYAQEGTAAHTLGEKCLLGGGDPHDFLGQIITVAGVPYEVTEEMADAVKMYVDYVRAKKAELELVYGDCEMLVEQKFKLDWLDPGIWGTSDVVLRCPGEELYVIDYKHGQGTYVPVEGNSQMRCYGLGAINANVLMYKTVTLCVIQPRHSDWEYDNCTETLTCGDLLFWGRSTLVRGAQATREKNAPLKAGKHCKFCRAKAICPEQKNQANLVARDIFTEHPVAKTPPAPSALTAEELKLILDKAKLVETWLNACRKYVQEGLANGSLDPEKVGHKLVAGRASRKWTNEEEAAETLDIVLGEGAYEKPKLLSPAKVEKLVKEKEAKELISTLVTTTRGQQLVALSDKRKALPAAASAAEVFGKVEVDNGG